jgi:hypothetical protein
MIQVFIVSAFTSISAFGQLGSNPLSPLREGLR